MSDAFHTEEDQGRLQAAHRTLSLVASDLASSRKSVTKDVTSAIETWKGPRSATFTTASGGAQIQLRRAHVGCSEVATILGEYAKAVGETQSELDGLKRQHDAALKPGPGDADLAGVQALEQESHRARRAQTFADMARDAKQELRRKADGYVGRVEQLTNQIAPRSDGLSAHQIRREVTGQLGVGGGHGKDLGIREALSLLQGAVRAAPAGSVNDNGTVNWDNADDLNVDMPAKGSTPTQVHTWWAGLSPREQNFLLNHHAKAVGSLDGIPVVDRDFANRIVLADTRAELAKELREKFPNGAPDKEILPTNNYDAPKLNPAWTEWNRLSGLKKTSDDLDKKLSGSSQPPYYLIGYQPFVGNGRVIMSQGNPDTATNTSVFVPGMTSRFTRIGVGMGYSSKMRTSAVHQGADPSSLATVTWYGYDAPQDLPQAATLGYAQRGGVLLDSFASGLRVTHEGARPSHATVISHSYGTTTAGTAASHGHTLQVDDLVMAASPGAGVGHGWMDSEPTTNGWTRTPGTTDATERDLHLDGSSDGHVFAARSKGDPIRWVDDTHLGVDPTNPGFGATVFGADPSGGHDGYWSSQQNPALRAMGQIIAGHGDEVAPPSADENVHPWQYRRPAH